jgi:hypothetical protein
MTQHQMTMAIRTLRERRKSAKDSTIRRDATKYQHGGLDGVKMSPDGGINNGQSGIAWAYDGNAGQGVVYNQQYGQPDIRLRTAPGYGGGLGGYSNPAVDDLPADYD